MPLWITGVTGGNRTTKRQLHRAVYPSGLHSCSGRGGFTFDPGAASVPTVVPVRPHDTEHELPRRVTLTPPSTFSLVRVAAQGVLQDFLEAHAPGGAVASSLAASVDADGYPDQEVQEEANEDAETQDDVTGHYCGLSSAGRLGHGDPRLR